MLSTHFEVLREYIYLSTRVDDVVVSYRVSAKRDAAMLALYLRKAFTDNVFEDDLAA